MLRITCPGCGISAEIAAEYLGRRIRCKRCREVFVADTAAPATPTELPTIGAHFLRLLEQLASINPQTAEASDLVAKIAMSQDSDAKMRLVTYLLQVGKSQFSAFNNHEHVIKRLLADADERVRGTVRAMYESAFPALVKSAAGGDWSPYNRSLVALLIESPSLKNAVARMEIVRLLGGTTVAPDVLNKFCSDPDPNVRREAEWARRQTNSRIEEAEREEEFWR